MLHPTPQFTPAQLIESGRRAEAEGRPDLAVRFYRYLAEHFAEAREASEALTSLGRIGATLTQARLWSAPTAAGAAHATRPRPADHRRRYRIGRGLAALFSAFGGTLALAALATVPAYVVVGGGGVGLPPFGLVPVAGGAAGLFVLGTGLVLAGQIARALFDQASATRDLLALERARLGLD